MILFLIETLHVHDAFPCVYFQVNDCSQVVISSKEQQQSVGRPLKQPCFSVTLYWPPCSTHSHTYGCTKQSYLFVFPFMKAKVLFGVCIMHGAGNTFCRLFARLLAYWRFYWTFSDAARENEHFDFTGTNINVPKRTQTV